MPELPEVEVLVRHLSPLVQRQVVRSIEVRRAKTVAPSRPREFERVLRGARFVDLARRGKYLVFQMCSATHEEFCLLGHLGMTGRMYLLRASDPEPKHAAVVLGFGKLKFVFEDTRYFGRLTLDTAPLGWLGPEPLDHKHAPASFVAGLRRSSQAIKIKLLDQTLVAGVGNIYASEALFRAGISPRRAACRLSAEQSQRLWTAIRQVLQRAIDRGSTVPLDWAGTRAADRLFYFGRASGVPDYYEEGLRVYDRAGQPCVCCGAVLRRITQAARSTYFCSKCQR